MNKKVFIAFAFLAICTTSLYAAPVHVTRIAAGLDSPLFVTAPIGDTDRLFVVEQHTGNIKIFNRTTGTIQDTPFLTISDISRGGEQGLLGLAFDPNYASNGYFYVNYTDAAGATNIRRYRSSANPNLANASSGTLILKFDQPQANHNGGWLGFGRDNYLYVASGDGGAAFDQGNGHTPGVGNAQDKSKLLGKILRIDVSADAFAADPNRNYAIPGTNPFVNTPGAAPEIWSYGLRNPWRASFDRLSGDLYIGDVGQGSREEVNFQKASSTGGENYAWRLREGSIPTPLAGIGGPKPADAVDPIYDYSHGSGAEQGITVIGGYVYRGPIEQLQGNYFFGDLTGKIWSFRTVNNETSVDITNFTNWTSQFIPDFGTIDTLVSFGEDSIGNLYMVDLDGEVFMIKSTLVSVSEPKTLGMFALGAILALGASRYRKKMAISM